MNEEIIIGFKEQTVLINSKGNTDITTGKVIVNDIEITSVEDWEKVTKSLVELERERNNYKELYEKENGNWNKLKEWLKEMINEIKENDVYDRTEYECAQIATLESTLARIEEIERL